MSLILLDQKPQLASIQSLYSNRFNLKDWTDGSISANMTRVAIGLMNYTVWKVISYTPWYTRTPSHLVVWHHVK